MALALPSGRRGQAFAVSVTLAGILLLWLGVVAPLIAWNAALAETRAQREVLASRMAALADSVPLLQRQIAASAVQGAAPVRASLEGATDAIAAAALQERMQDMARKAGVTLSSAEALPVDAVGPYRRIGLRLVVEGRWGVLTRFLQAIEQTSPRILADDLQMQRGPLLAGSDATISASFAVFGFRPASR